MKTVGRLLSQFATAVPDAAVGAMSLNGAPGMRIDMDGELDTAVSFVVEDGRITRIYAVRNPRKLERLAESVELSR
jgi:RNA polymerase sigma-70 factor (ECF subfamily)